MNIFQLPDVLESLVWVVDVVDVRHGGATKGESAMLQTRLTNSLLFDHVPQVVHVFPGLPI